MPKLRVVFLGTGTSHGVPMIGCRCEVCRSNDPRDQRMRTSVAVHWADRAVLIDTTPELRLQCLACDITRVDAILFTHQHADHVAGLDDLRRFNALQRTALPCYGNPATLDVLQRMFPYAFSDDPSYPSAKPRLTHHAIDGPLDLFGMQITPVPLLHGQLPILGYRFGRFAYCTDCSRIPEESRSLLADLDVLVLDALRRRPHPTHMNLEQAIATAREIGAKKTLFTHIAHELMHEPVNAELPAAMALAYDGQVVEVATA
jgi:phosphoribosyl 1,2-cyclic phosphate phosphodiesterase